MKFGRLLKMIAPLIIGTLMVSILTLGIFGNLNVIYATKKFKELQTRNGILVAITAFFNLASFSLFTICEINAIKTTVEVLTGTPPMLRKKCFPSIILHILSYNISFMLLLFIAIDRLIAVSSPLA
ncbi:unnamed protein product [Gongylonema pulchrum]|uniref:G_PROTEIN_RECEP_F1_2 domain-containing protein n=1 Tax=Gongylonema pulchrum TaxID=637853 RepID=A0A183ED27_9BILA|nr:unnamed protein product [Gongylonema pulchrum]